MKLPGISDSSVDRYLANSLKILNHIVAPRELSVSEYKVLDVFIPFFWKSFDFRLTQESSNFSSF